MRTLFEPLPEKWENKPLKSLSRVLRRGKSPVYSEEYQGLMVINQDCIRWYGVELDKAKYYVSSEASTIPEELFLSENDILLNSTGTGTIGRVSIWKWKDQRAVLDSHVTLIRINPTLANPFYVKYLLSSELGQRYLEAFCYTGSTNQIELSKRYLSKLEIPLPPDNEQGIIASILSKVDEAIDATKETIAKAERLKTALMQNLLTGRFRPDGTWLKEEDFYTDEKFGKVPKGWKVARVKNFGDVRTGKTPPTDEENNFGSNISSNYMFITPGDLGESRLILKTERYVTEKGLTYTYKVPAYSVCVVCIGSTIGKIGINESEACTNQQVNTVTLNDRNDAFFFYYMMQYRSAHFKEYAGINVTPQVNKSGFKKYRLLQPESKLEQEQISTRLLKVDLLIEEKQIKIQKLERLKKALMQNLLTGKVRVKIEK